MQNTRPDSQYTTMKSGRPTFLWIVIALFMLGLSPIVHAQNSQATVTQLPFEGSYINPCNGDTINVTGGHTLTLDRFQDNKGFHFGLKINSQGAGTGQTGVNYKIIDIFQTQFNVPEGSDNQNLTVSTEMNNHLIAKGNEPDYFLHSTLHITFNADGTPVITIDNTQVRCQ